MVRFFSRYYFGAFIVHIHQSPAAKDIEEVNDLLEEKDISAHRFMRLLYTQYRMDIELTPLRALLSGVKQDITPDTWALILKAAREAPTRARATEQRVPLGRIEITEKMRSDLNALLASGYTVRRITFLAHEKFQNFSLSSISNWLRGEATTVPKEQWDYVLGLLQEQQSENRK